MCGKRSLTLAVLVGLSFLTSAYSEEGPRNVDPVNSYDVAWTSPSNDFNGSMPIGNGDIGLNVWVEPNGDLLLLISKTDAWSENCRLLKLGRVRVKFSPQLLPNGAPFLQTLHLRHGEFSITTGDAETATTTRIWVDANRPVIRVETEGATPFDMRVKSGDRSCANLPARKCTAPTGLAAVLLPSWSILIP